MSDAAAVMSMNARVAQALGFEVRDASIYRCRASHVIFENENFPRPHGVHNHIRWECFLPDEDGGGWMECRDYDSDWNALMPELVRLRIGLSPTTKAMSPGTLWIAEHAVTGVWSDNPKPAHAACEVILKLHSAGKLPQR